MSENGVNRENGQEKGGAVVVVVLEWERKARQDPRLDLQPQGLDAPSQRIPARHRRVQLADGIRHQSAPQNEGRAIIFPGRAPVQAAGFQKLGDFIVLLNFFVVFKFKIAVTGT